MTSDRSLRLYQIVSEQPIENIEGFVRSLRSGTIERDSSAVDLRRILIGPNETISLFRKLLREWLDESQASCIQLADVIEAVSIYKSRMSLMPHAELVWSGPDVGHPTARKTFQVMNEMLQHASESVLIVGYSLFLRGDLAQDLLARLGRLSSKGVQVRFIVDRRYKGWSGNGIEGHSVREIQENWFSDTPKPLIYSWASEDDENSKLHAKLMLVDDRDLLVTSANLTGAGLETNLELGLRIQGDTARNCAEHFSRLINSGFFIDEV
jgi:phosphatidylserine/phosphatidylglycerophosphate/cardiolipin synthase-like enzyme